MSRPFRVKAPALPARQGGQALVLGLLFCAVGTVWLYQLFDLGQWLAARARLRHAADAVAFSGAVTQARALNLHAYLNRAHVGHQVAMAHLVTLGSWAAWGATQGQQRTRGNPPAALITLLFGPAHGAAYGGASAAGQGLSEALSGALAAHEAAVHRTLAMARQSLIQDLAADRMATMRAVLQANYAAPGDVLPSMEVDEQGLRGRIGLYGDGAGSSLRDLIEQAVGRYGFLQRRDGEARSLWPADARCPWRRHVLRRRGQTQLDAQGRWQSDDTQSFHAVRSNRWIGCYYREYPMGWGLRLAARGRPQADFEYAGEAPPDFSAQAFWRWVRAATAWDIVAGRQNPLANSRAVAAAVRGGAQGLPAYADLADPARAESMGLSVRLVLPQVAIRTGRRLAWLGEDSVLGLPLDSAPAQLSTTAHAHSYFARPHARADGKEERPSLFQPFWQARLRAAPPAGAMP